MSKESMILLGSGRTRAKMYILCIITFQVLTYVAFFNESLRYLKYALPLLPLSLVMISNYSFISKKHIEYFGKFALYYFVIFLVSFLASLHQGFYSRFFVELFLVMCPLIFAFLLSVFYDDNYRNQYIAIMFFGPIGLYLLDKGESIIELISNPGSLLQAIFNSTIDTESGLAFVFGILFLGLLMLKYKTRYLWLSLVLCVFSFKRISLIGISIGYLIWVFYKTRENVIKKNRVIISLLFCLFNFLAVFAFYQLISGKYDSLIIQYTGLSPNQFLMGRYNLYSAILSDIDLNYFGIGFGKIAQTLQDNGSTILVFHSDILKNFIEFGPIIFLCWMYFFFYVNSMNLRILILAIYLNIVFLSDNVFIYFEVMFYFYFFAMIYSIQSSKIPQNLDEL